MSNNSPSFAVLDPDTYKQQLITYLKSQTAFKDYDFKGSTMNVLLDILSQNTYQNAFYMNMIFSELFLDTAQLKNSVVSRIKEMQYCPTSKRSSEATIDVEIGATGTNIIEIPKGFKFSGLNSNSSYTFVTGDNSVHLSADGIFNVSNLVIYEGFITTDTYVVDYSDETQKFVLSNPNIDTSSLELTLNENGETYNLQQAKNLFGLTSNSYVYFLQPSFNDQYEISFGDSISGHKPLNNSIIQATYRVCSGPSADGVMTFAASDNLANYNNADISYVKIITKQSSSAGGNAEDINSIKYNAVMNVKTQDRAVVPSDYAQLILENFKYIKDVFVYGGTASSVSVDYGKVFMAIINTSGNSIAKTQKDEVVSYISQRNTQGITPIVVDPEFIYLDVSTLIHANITQSNISVPQYIALVTNGILSYNKDNLQKFNTVFRYSKLTDLIDSLDKYILSNETIVTMKKNVQIELNKNYNITTNFYNEIVPGTVSTSKFSSNGITYYISDLLEGRSTNGTLYMFNSNTPTLYTSVGRVDYKNGIITTKPLFVNDFLNSPGIVVKATPVSKDIHGKSNNIVEIDNNTLTVSVVNN